MGKGEGGSEALGLRVRAVSIVLGQVCHCQARIVCGRFGVEVMGGSVFVAVVIVAMFAVSYVTSSQQEVLSR